VALRMTAEEVGRESRAKEKLTDQMYRKNTSNE
jgi:hypothetical protein